MADEFRIRRAASARRATRPFIAQALAAAKKAGAASRDPAASRPARRLREPAIFIEVKLPHAIGRRAFLAAEAL
ncbi:hypothetical protein [Chelativorans xinjiangense]|uniref:hypothetical protein n=1 Tax=Chelativorans xinjiangense TaxID=2681485 RepID=UPI00135804CF|nr:hypothetical protein [Chelativorans xinjiangense]